MRILAAVLVAAFFFSFGCSWVGRTAGKASAKIERKVDDVQQGYKDGYKEEQAKALLRAISFGGGCINDTLVHTSNPHLPFGGVGSSGLGSYHGKKSFDTFTHYKSIVYRGKADLPFRYPPFGEYKTNMLKQFLK